MTLSNLPPLVTVFGGSGFVGRHVVRALARRGYRIRVAVRRPDLAGFLQPLGNVGQISFVQANLRYRKSVDSAVQGADHVINCVGILFEAGRNTFDSVQEFGARAVAEAARSVGASLTHVSAIGADVNSESVYARTKGRAEKAVLDTVPNAVILRPSIVFGPEDGFFNKFAEMARFSPFLPLVGGGQTKFQPVYVDGSGRSRRPCRGRRTVAGQDLRNRRPGSADLPRLSRNDAEDDRPQADAAAPAVRSGLDDRFGRSTGAVHRTAADIGPGDPAQERQCRLRCSDCAKAARSREWAFRRHWSRPCCHPISFAIARRASTRGPARQPERYFSGI